MESVTFLQAKQGVLHGMIGALDGLAIKIKCPIFKLVSDPGNYYCGKGLYALNVQAICDRMKRFIWVSGTHRRSLHDSVAFGDTTLMKLVTNMAAKLKEHGFFIGAHSEYTFLSFLYKFEYAAGPCGCQGCFQLLFMK
jgi:hypothetical protein